MWMTRYPVVNTNALGHGLLGTPRHVAVHPSLGQGVAQTAAAMAQVQERRRWAAAAQANYQNLAAALGPEAAQLALEQANTSLQEAEQKAQGV